jgi:hypothetical protein
MAKDDDARPQGAAEGSERIVIDGDDDKIVITIEARERSGRGAGTGGGQGRPGPMATPFLLVPDGPGDTGARPLPISQALANPGIQPVITNPGSANGWTDFAIQLSCAVSNLGVVGSAAALAEFYVGDQFGIWNPSRRALMPAQVQANAELVGRTAFFPGGIPRGRAGGSRRWWTVSPLHSPSYWRTSVAYRKNRHEPAGAAARADESPCPYRPA